MPDEQYKTWLNNTRNSLTECYKKVFEADSTERLWHKRDEELAKELQTLLKKEKLIESLKMHSPNDQLIIHLDELYDEQLEDYEFQFTTQGCQDHLFNSIARNFCVTILDLNTSLSKDVKQRIGFNYAPNPQVIQWLDNLITPDLFKAKNETLPDNKDWVESLRIQEVLMIDKSLQVFLKGVIETPACYKPYAIIFRYYWDNLAEAQTHAQNIPALLADKILDEGLPGFCFNEFSMHRFRIAERSKPGLEMGFLSEIEFQNERLSCLNSY